MIRPIMKDPMFLARKSEPATKADLPLAQDLIDTLRAHAHECVGMAGNMIGEAKCVIAFENEGKYMLMYNPQIIRKSTPYEAEEGCLSLVGQRKTIRYQMVEVSYLDQNFRPQTMKYTGWTAQIIQHEIDHCDGILI